jgi:hypothetical protein
VRPLPCSVLRSQIRLSPKTTHSEKNYCPGLRRKSQLSPLPKWRVRPFTFRPLVLDCVMVVVPPPYHNKEGLQRELYRTNQLVVVPHIHPVNSSIPPRREKASLGLEIVVHKPRPPCESSTDERPQWYHTIVTMGNSQCGAPSSKWTNEAEDKVIYNPYLQTFKTIGVAPQSTFLKVHIEDRPEKCLMSTEEVVSALVKQAMELLRRGVDIDDVSSLFFYDDCEPPAMSHKVTSLQFSDATVAAPSTYAPSDLNQSTVTGVTTNTNEAQIVGNNAHADRSGIIRRKQPESKGSISQSMPSILGAVYANEVEMQEQLQDAITKVSKKETEIRRLGRLIRSIEAGEGCTMIPVGLVQDPLPAQFGPLAREYMTILQVRMKPRFTDYFQSHFVRLLPDSALTREVSRGITLNRMSPLNTSTRVAGQPPLTRIHSDSTTSVEETLESRVGPPSDPVRLVATGSPFADLGLTGSLGLIHRRGGTSSRSVAGRVNPPGHYIVLLNRRTGVPLAICALKAGWTGPPIVRIYATKRRMYGQRPASTTQKLGLDWSKSLSLFPWAEIVTEGRYPSRVTYSIFLAFGNNGRFEESPSYRAEHASVGSPTIRIVGRTEREQQKSGCAILTLCREDGAIEENDLFWNLSIAKGIDPALFLCFAAFVDEAIEKTMRQQAAAASK